jgi:hypothetical protein
MVLALTRAMARLSATGAAVIAFGGLQDCCLQFPDATVDGAMAALGLAD